MKNVKHPNLALNLNGARLCAVCVYVHCNYINVVWSFQMAHTHTNIINGLPMLYMALYPIHLSNAFLSLFSFTKWEREKYGKNVMCPFFMMLNIIIIVVVRPEIAITFGAFNDKVFKLTFRNVYVWFFSSRFYAMQLIFSVHGALPKCIFFISVLLNWCLLWSFIYRKWV